MGSLKEVMKYQGLRFAIYTFLKCGYTSLLIVTKLHVVLLFHSFELSLSAACAEAASLFFLHC